MKNHRKLLIVAAASVATALMLLLVTHLMAAVEPAKLLGCLPAQVKILDSASDGGGKDQACYWHLSCTKPHAVPADAKMADAADYEFALNEFRKAFPKIPLERYGKVVFRFDRDGVSSHSGCYLIPGTADSEVFLFEMCF